MFASGKDIKTLKYFLWGLGVLGTVATWGRSALDGSLNHVFEALSSHQHMLPGTDSVLLKSFTGIYPVDYLFRTLVVFFWEAVDGSHPAVTITGIYFSGQLFPIIAAIYLDGLRSGNGASALNPSLWFMVFGAAAIGSSGALWALLYLLTSPLTSTIMPHDGLQRASLITSSIAAKLLLPAEVLGFVLPVILMGLPSPLTVSNSFQQWAIVIWNTFPLIMYAIIRSGEALIYRMTAQPHPSPPSVSKDMHLSFVRYIGVASIFGGFAMHISTVALSVSSMLFASLFNSKYVKDLDLFALATPPLALTSGSTVGDGIWSFMVWDQVFGYSFVIIVFLAQFRNVLRFSQNSQPFDWVIASAACFLLSLAIGPGTVAMLLSWLRDEILYAVPVRGQYIGKSR